MATQKTVWVAKDGSYHECRLDAENWDSYCMLRSEIENLDLDWRDGVGSDAATPNTIAMGLLQAFDFTPKPVSCN